MAGAETQGMAALLLLSLSWGLAIQAFRLTWSVFTVKTFLSNA